MSKTLERSATTEEVVAELERRSAFMFVSHVKPDGDTLGAGLALGLALKGLGKRVGYFQQDPVPRNLRFLPDAEFVARAVPADLPADTLWVFCDMSDFSRAGEFLPPICVMRLLRAMNVPITKEIATNILTTIMTDTGAFMHSNTTAEVLRLSAELMDAGADKHEITEEIFANKRFAATKLLGMALDRATVEDDGRYCWTYVDEAMLRECNADGEDTEEIIQHLRQVENVEAAALFKDFDGAVRVSLRSSGRINVQLAAASLGGGGHFMAAGLTYDGDLAAAIPGVHAALKAQGL
jgi:phosphoesterase RecJ-like protein